MAPKTDTKADAIRLMSSLTNFDRSAISGQNCRPDATPRQEEMPSGHHCGRIDGRTVQALIKKGIVTSRVPLAYGRNSTLMLAKPTTA